MKTTRFQRVAKRLQLVRQVVFEIFDARRIHRQVVGQLFLRWSGFLWREKRETNGWFYFCQGSSSKQVRLCNTSGEAEDRKKSVQTYQRCAVKRKGLKILEYQKAFDCESLMDLTMPTNVKKSVECSLCECGEWEEGKRKRETKRKEIGCQRNSANSANMLTHYGAGADCPDSRALPAFALTNLEIRRNHSRVLEYILEYPALSKPI